jgi:hypothetical protein
MLRFPIRNIDADTQLWKPGGSMGWIDDKPSGKMSCIYFLKWSSIKSRKRVFNFLASVVEKIVTPSGNDNAEVFHSDTEH